MAKNHEKFEYFDVAVPKTNQILLRYLQEIYENTNTPGSQLLVQLATERVKQLSGDAGAPSLSAFGPLMAAMFSALPQQQAAAAPNQGAVAPVVQPPGAIQPLGYDLMQIGAAADDLEDYGDPD